MDTQYSSPSSQDSTDPRIELMDRLIQGLYGLGLKLEYCIALIDESPDQARAGLDAAITDLGDVIDDLRRHLPNHR
ncbi:MAG TPA: histidine kinase [Dehalococcoidia bacterium]